MKIILLCLSALCILSCATKSQQLVDREPTQEKTQTKSASGKTLYFENVKSKVIFNSLINLGVEDYVDGPYVAEGFEQPDFNLHFNVGAPGGSSRQITDLELYERPNKSILKMTFYAKSSEREKVVKTKIFEDNSIFTQNIVDLVRQNGIKTSFEQGLWKPVDVYKIKRLHCFNEGMKVQTYKCYTYTEE